MQLASPAPSGGVNCNTCVVGKDCICLATAVNEMEGQNVPLPARQAKVERRNEADSCGLCTSGSCLCEELGIRPSTTDESAPSSSQGTKRKRSISPAPHPQQYPMEIDFTSSFSSALSPTSTRDEIATGGCGFCSDGTPCVCLQNTLPPLLSGSAGQEVHPEAIRRAGGKRPIINDVKVLPSSVPRVGSPDTIASGNGGCTGEPGTSPPSPSPSHNVNSRDVYAMSLRSNVDVILSNIIKDIGNAGIRCTVYYKRCRRRGQGDLFTMQRCLPDIISTSEFQ
jgi:hypothetical protein